MCVRVRQVDNKEAVSLMKNDGPLSVSLHCCHPSLISLSCSFLSLYSSHSPLLCPSMRETAIDEGTIFRPICFGVFFFIQPISFRRYFLQPSGPNLSFPPAHSKNIFMPEMIGELDKSGSLCILSCFFLTGGLERCIIQMS